MQFIYGCSACYVCCCHGLSMLSCLKGCLIFQCTEEMAASIFTSLVIRRYGICLVGSVQNIPLEGGQSLACYCLRLSLLQNMLGETLPALPSVLDHSIIQCLTLCYVDTAILVVLSAGEQHMHSVGRHVINCKLLNDVHPVIFFVGDPAVSIRGFTYRESVNQFHLERLGRSIYSDSDAMQ